MTDPVAYCNAKRHVTLEVEGPSGIALLGPWLLGPPTVATAIAVLEHAPLALLDDEYADSHWDDLVEALVPWWPPSMLARLRATSAGRTLLPGIAPSLLLASLPDAAQPAAEDAQDGAVKRAQESGWGIVLADYRRVYNCPDPLSESWPFFTEQVAHMDSMRARTSLELLTAIGSAFAGGKSVDDLFKRAGWWVEPTPEEKAAKQADALDAIMQQFVTTRSNPSA